MADAVAQSEFDCAIVGGGAAGLAAAIFTARRDSRATIVVVDGAKRLGAKILISGGGRCNVTNQAVTADDFWGGSRHVIRRVLGQFPSSRAIEFFGELGVRLHMEPGGKLFPDSNKARTILNALLREAARLGIRIETGNRVTGVERRDDWFELASSGAAIRARKLVLATGGLSVPQTGSDGLGYRLAESLGHTVIAQTPALVALNLAGDFHDGLSGISQEVGLAVRAAEEKPVRLRGSLLWTHFGVSGPVVLNASRHWHAAILAGRSVTISISFLPGDDFGTADRRLLELTAAQPGIAVQNAVASLMPQRVAQALLAKIAVPANLPIGQLMREDRRKLTNTLIDWPLPVCGSRGYKTAEVTAGGVPLHEISPNTMESRCCPGLYLVGEILDVDGRIGGFNFQWAWSSAWVAAQGLVGR